MFNTPDELQMFLMAQTAMQHRRVRPPMPAPFPMGMQTAMGYAPPMRREMPEQAPAQWPFYGPPPNLPRLSQFMMPRTEAAVVPAPMAAMQPAPAMQPQLPVRASGPTFPAQPNDALNQQVAPRMNGMNPGGGMNPMSMALLAAGMRMLQSAGPSTQRVSLGQALGSGGLEGLQTYASLRNQQAEEAFRERQLIETGELRREQIASSMAFREAQAGELASKAEERQRNAEWMQRYQAAAPEERLALLEERYPEKKYEAELRDTKDPALQQKIDALVESGIPETQAKGIAAGRYTVSVNPISGERQVIDISTGRPVGGVSSNFDSPPAETAVPADVQASKGTGASGFFGNIANKVKDALGLPMGQPKVQEAINALDNLNVQTTSLLQAAVPGRPSVALMNRLKALTVEPGSLLQADQGAAARLKQTRDMLSVEVNRMERDVLSKPSMFRPEQLTEARLNHSQLKQLLREYDQILASFNRPNKGNGSLEFPDKNEEQLYQQWKKNQ